MAPGFVDCHTHLVFGGSRAQEYARPHDAQRRTRWPRLGIPTGIQATVQHDAQQQRRMRCQASAAQRLQRMLRSGTTTVESKSGYGLSLEKEIELLQVNRQLQGSQPVDIVSTLPGRARLSAGDAAPALPGHPDPGDDPAGGRSRAGRVLRRVLRRGVLHSGRKPGAFWRAGCATACEPKIHVDAYANIGGCEVAAELKAVSADHLNYTSRAEIERLAGAGVVGVVMPALDFAVRHPQPFDARRCWNEG